MIVFLVQSTCLLLVALALTWWQKKNPIVRLWIIRLSLVAVVGLAVATPFFTEREDPIVPIPVRVQAPDFLPSTDAMKPVVVAEHTVPVVAVTSPTDYGQWAWRIYLVGVGLLLLRLFMGHIHLMLVRSQSRDFDYHPVYELSKEIGVSPPDLRLSKLVTNPFVAGVFLPAIYVPISWIEETSDEDQQAILWHELGHVKHCDLFWAGLLRLLCICLWPNPLIWMLKGPMTSAEEEICDRHVLSAGIPDHTYADCLLRLRESLRQRPCPMLGIGAVSRRSSLGERIEAILDRTRSRSVQINWRGALAISGALTLVALCFGWVVAKPNELTAFRGLPNDHHWSYATELRPFTISLSNGVQVQARLVRPATFGAHSVVLAPNGKVITDHSPEDQVVYANAGKPDDAKQVEINVLNPFREDYRIRTIPPHLASGNVIDVNTNNGVIDLPIGVGAGPFRVIEHVPAFTRPFRWKSKPAYWIPDRKDESEVYVAATIPEQFRQWDTRLCIFDRWGREIWESGSISTGSGEIHTEVDVPHKDRIAYAELRTRPYVWGVIKGIHTRVNAESFARGARLKSGGWISLDWIADASSREEGFWTPDGRKAGHPAGYSYLDFAGNRTTFHEVTFHLVPHRCYEPSTAAMKMPESSFPLQPNSYYSSDSVAWQIPCKYPVAWQATDLEFDIASGRPLVTTCRPGEGELHPTLALSSTGETDVRLQVPPRFRGHELRMTVTDQDGKNLEPHATYEHKTGESDMRATFENVSPSQIKSVSLLSRMYEHVVFRDVHLYPNKR